jgi:hypothetical protein
MMSAKDVKKVPGLKDHTTLVAAIKRQIWLITIQRDLLPFSRPQMLLLTSFLKGQ